MSAVNAKQKIEQNSPSWISLEMAFYFIWLFNFYVFGTPLVYKASRLHRKLYPYSGLRDEQYKIAWFTIPPIDVQDQQYDFFRQHLPLLFAAYSIYTMSSQIVRHVSGNLTHWRLYFYFLANIVFITYVYGITALFMITIAGINFAIADLLAGTRALQPVAWLFNCAVLLLNEHYRGYRFAELWPLYGWLDEHRGIAPWHILFNLTVLRQLSFAIDLHWARIDRPLLDRSGGHVTFSQHAERCSQCFRNGPKFPCYWWREKHHHALTDYGFVAYLAYIFYVPLHFAGPITTFNAFLSHVKFPQRNVSTTQLMQYAFRLLFSFLLLEVLLHSFYTFALSYSPIFWSLDCYTLAVLSYWTLNAIWLKFTVIWRFFRFWGLLDGVDTPENMVRCVNNHYSVQDFWRTWHRSFNRWLVRYIYIPLAQSSVRSGDYCNVQDISSPNDDSQSLSMQKKRFARLSSSLLRIAKQLLRVFAVFTFVAFWHDRTLQLLAWGWLVALIFVPELIVRFIGSRISSTIRLTASYRWAKGAAGALCVFAMMAANLVGYSNGIGGTSHVIKLFWQEGGSKCL